MNTIDTLVQMRIDELRGLAGSVQRERELRAGPDTFEATAQATTIDTAIETAGPAVAAAAESDCGECPSSVQAA
jgi:hypothetical protein